MNTAQVQLKISLSEQLSDLLKSKANKLGLPVTQLVKYLIVKEVENEEYPTFKMSSRTEQRAKEAMEQIDEAVEVEDIAEYFKNL
jgi:antitoxin component of RelBE/YafQ-DinJ toxin-antitoxin module